jgi:hypothetical protein
MQRATGFGRGRNACMLHAYPGLILSSNPILPNRDCRVVSQEVSLIHACLLIIKTSREQSLVEVFYVCSRPCRIDVYSAKRVKRGNASRILPIEAFHVAEAIFSTSS